MVCHGRRTLSLIHNIVLQSSNNNRSMLSSWCLLYKQRQESNLRKIKIIFPCFADRSCRDAAGSQKSGRAVLRAWGGRQQAKRGCLCAGGPRPREAAELSPAGTQVCFLAPRSFFPKSKQVLASLRFTASGGGRHFMLGATD